MDVLPYPLYKYELLLNSDIIHFKCYFTPPQLPLIEKHLKDFILMEMYEYRCEGCHYCCYGNESYRKWCERRFKSESEINDYFELCQDKSMYKISATISKVNFVPIKSKESPPGVGYEMKNELVWEFTTDNPGDYHTNFNIKLTL